MDKVYGILIADDQETPVDLRGLQTEMSVALQMIAPIFWRHYVDCIITSGLEGDHGEHSLHYLGYALDFRTKHIPPAERKQVAWEIRAALRNKKTQTEKPSQYDVVLHKTHLHVEFDPD